MLATACNVSTTNNVVGFKTGNAYESIELFLESNADRSKDTEKNYRSWISQFFMFTRNKSLNEVTWNDIQSIQYRDSLMFRKHLINDINNSSRTANTKMAGIKSLFEFITKVNKDIKIDTDVVDLKPLAENKNNGWGSLTEDEWKALLEYCSNEKRKPVEKRTYFEMVIITAARTSALLDMTFNDIKERTDHQTGTIVKVIEMEDKGKFIQKPISDETYEKLMSLKTLTTKDSDKIINVSSKTLAKTLSDFCEWYGIDAKGRRIVLHSLKKASLDLTFKNTGGNLLKTAKQANHSGINLIYDTYVGKNSSLTEAPSYSMLNKDENLEALEGLSKEELLALIKKSGKWVTQELVKNL